jgi:asparagine synthase (glutamine-hydrolysing)
MCGIAGILNISGNLSPREMQRLALEMALRMEHRGPDDSGVWVDPSGYCAFSHRRLSIIDTSSAGKQPMLSRDGHSCITFNGEIYNYLDIRADLEKFGHQFSSSSDTEVLLAALRQYGETLFEKMDGMYAFGYLDVPSREVLLARDPFGEKPLYYTVQNGYLAFASELHCLSVLPGFDVGIDRDSLAQYLAFQYVPSPRSIYAKVSKLPPGHFMRIKPDGKIEVQRHFRFKPQNSPSAEQPMDQLADELEDILIRSIKRRMISDVPLGAFLSGGVDSSAVVALMRKVLGRDVKTFSLGVHDSPESEHLFARQMALHVGADHHDLVLTPDVPKLIHTIGACLDEPNADSSCLPTYLLSQFARRQVTVLLSGDGGDEMFGGYGRYFSTLDEEERFVKGAPELANWSPSRAYLSNRILIFELEHTRDLFGELPAQTEELLARLRSDLDAPSSPLISRLRELDMHTYLPGAVLAKVDRMSMQHALEVRCPILSIEVARFAEKLHASHCYAAGHGKLVLKEVASRYIPRAWLDRRKQGFSVPTHLWNQRDFVATLKKMTLSQDSCLPNLLDSARLARFVKRQEEGGFSAYQVWSVLLLEIWLRAQTAKASTKTLWRSSQTSHKVSYSGSYNEPSNTAA